jgi:plasmid stabilization system protein ParE
MPNLRHVTIDQAIYWFLVDEDALIVRVLAIFFGGQDHIRRMLARLLQKP